MKRDEAKERGSYVTMQGGRFVYYRREQPGSGPSRRLAEHGGEIATASVAELAHASPDWMIEDTQLRLRRWPWFRIYAITACFLAMTALATPGMTAVLLMVFSIFGVAIYRWDRDRRTARVRYDVDDPELMQRLQLAGEAARQLAQCARLWHVFFAVSTSDWKRNAGADTLIQRTAVRCIPGALPHVALNISTWCVPAGPQRLLFLPDRLLVWDGKHLAAIPYEELEAHAGVTTFIESRSWGLPPDSIRVGSTWRYVRRDGGPDRRFNNNAELPVMEYGELQLRSRSGLHLVFQTSTSTAGYAAERALATLAQRAAQPVAASVALAAPAASAAPASLPPAPPPQLAHQLSAPPLRVLPRTRSMAILLRYLAAADRRIDSVELELAQSLLSQLAPADPDVPELIAQFRTLPADHDAAHAAARDIAIGGSDYRTWMLGALERMAGADGKITLKETERMRELRRWLS